jgi:hypothetical protein
MKKVLIAFLLFVILSGAVMAADTLKTPYPAMWYADHYPFITYKGSIFSFESELLWPEGFRRLDSAKLSPYQFWVSHFPLWHSDMGVGSLVRGRVYPPENISRNTCFPWRTTKFYDCVIPLQMLAEYMLYLKKPYELAYRPRVGDEPLTYKEFLKSEIAYNAMGKVIFQPGEKRKPTDSLFNLFFDLVATNTNYGSLEANCTPVADSIVMPGDLLIGRDSVGLTGQVLVVLLVVGNKAGEKRYIIGRGCDDGCDLFIPLEKDDRRYPWLTLDEVKKHVVQPVSGFFRLRVPTEEHD